MTRKKIRNIIMYLIIIVMLVTLYMLQFHPRFQKVTVTYQEMLPASENPLKFNPQVEVHKLLNIINYTRMENGLQELSFSDELNEYASIRAEECFDTWSHTRPNGEDGIDLIPNDRWRGENLAKNYNYADDVLDAWMDSPTHKDNILFGEFSQCGIAYAQKGNGENRWCILFTD